MKNKKSDSKKDTQKLFKTLKKKTSVKIKKIS